MPREFRLRPDAPETIAELAGPQVKVAAQVLAQTIPSNVPVHDGVAKQRYSNLQVVDGDAEGEARIVGFPFLWHWLEYGTRWNPAYRPVQNTAIALGFHYEAH